MEQHNETPTEGGLMYDLALSLWRTCVPYIVAFLGVQAARLGVHIDNATVTSALTTGFGTAYYAAFRYLEAHAGTRWGWFLGAAKSPSYHPAAAAAGGVDYSTLPEGG
jgi:hypothetical protein